MSKIVEVFVQNVICCLIVVRRVVVDMVLLEIGEKSFFIRQLGGVFRIHSPRFRRGARYLLSRNSFPRGRCRSVVRDVRGLSSGRYEDGFLIAIRWNFVVNRFVVVPLGCQDAGEGIGDLAYETRAVLQGEVELGQSKSPTHKAASRIENRHQPAEGVVQCPYGELESLDVRTRRPYASYDGVTFAFGCRIVTFSAG